MNSETANWAVPIAATLVVVVWMFILIAAGG
jgi:hypothetical protein